MKLLIVVAATVALATARPETYKEQEDFQYSRSSTDEGSKSGFYGAQRGNMGGNYERAHNMDGLAQHQMSTAVKQVNGELGDALNTRTGSVFTSANSKGLYGSGNYDLSNLHGRNFEEGAHAYDGSQSHASLSSHHGYDSHQSASSLHSAGYNSHAHGSGYGHHGSSGYGHSGNLQAVDTAQGAGYGQALSHSSGYHSESGYQAHSSAANQQTLHSGYAVQPQSRLVLATPVRVVGRPGQRVAIPVGVQTYDAAHATHSASTLDHNSIDINDAEVLNNADTVVLRPTSDAKRYESAYSYRKQWEKHDVKPEVIALAIPTENPFPKNSELYDASNNNYQASGYDSHRGYSSSQHSNSQIKASSAAQQAYLQGADSLHSSLATGSLSDAHSHGAYSSGQSADLLNAVGTVDKPKAYQSSYSYHKSWERQGDPYVIKPVGGAYVDDASQRLTAASSSHAHSSRHSGSQYHSSQALEDCDCDEYGQVRVARSTNYAQEQQNEQNWESLEDLGQQVQKNDWATAQLRTQNENLEDLGQQVQKNDWIAPRYQSGQLESQNLEDLGQQVQKNDWTGSYVRNGQNEKLEDLGQQVQKNDWIGTRYRSGQIESQNREDQQVQNNAWTDSRFRNGQIENQNLGQETQQPLNSNFDEPKNLYGWGRGDLGQQASSQWHPAQENTKWRY